MFKVLRWRLTGQRDPEDKDMDMRFTNPEDVKKCQDKFKTMKNKVLV